MLAVVNVLVMACVAFFAWKRERHALQKLYWPALLAKVGAGIALGIIYSTYYTSSDSFTFFEQAQAHAEIAQTGFIEWLRFLFAKREGYFLGEHRTIFYTKITSVFVLFTGGNYWVTASWYSLLSFFAAWYLVKTIHRFFNAYTLAACIAFLFFPSVVFWSSGIIKESLAMAALFVLVAIFLRAWMHDKISVWCWILAVICSWTVFNLKYYYLGVFLPIAISTLCCRWIIDRFNLRRAIAQVGVWCVLLSASFISIMFLHPNFALHKILLVTYSTNVMFMEACTPDDVIHFYALQPSWSSMLVNAPWALFSGLFRPFVWEANNIFKVITALENLVLLVLTILAMPSLLKIRTSPHRLLILAGVSYIVILTIFLALSTPNFGTLARYAVGYLPFVVLLVANQPFITRRLSFLVN